MNQNTNKPTRELSQIEMAAIRIVACGLVGLVYGIVKAVVGW